MSMVSTSPIPRPTALPFRASSAFAKTAVTRKKVRMASTTTVLIGEEAVRLPVVAPRPDAVPTSHASAKAATIAPRHCANQ